MMFEDELTCAQRAAVEDLDHDLLVSAGAGTGKTRVLAYRFIHIAQTGRAAVDEILTLTFTDKAAHEMKQRIVGLFGQLGREDCRRQVETAYISTVHSFCGRVLRENALEAAVDPYFVQLDEPQAAIVQRQVYDDLIRRAHASDDAAVLALAFNFGSERSGAARRQGDLRELLIALYHRTRSLGKAPTDLVVSPAPSLDDAAEATRLAVDAALALRPSTDAHARALSAAQALAPRIRAILDLRTFDWAAYQQLTDAAKVFKAVGSGGHRQIMAAAQAALGQFAAALLAERAAEHAEALKRLLGEFDAAYRAAKDEQGALDFDDLLAKSRELFGVAEHPTPSARRYRERFKFYLMDEFQDTNRLQMSVVAPLLRPQSSFTVGDAKQSIYRFLYADVGLFLQRGDDLHRSGGVTRYLGENFRSHADLIAFTNALFRELWAEDGFPFAPLQAAKRFGPREEPRIEALVVDGANMRDMREREARMIAARVADMTGLDGSAPMRLTAHDRDRPDASFRDILILFRSTSDIPIYEDALSRYDIPYYTVSGRGFYNTQEVQDLYRLLSATENPMDDVATAAVLRSPLVGVSDEALYWLGAPRERAPRDDDDSEPQGAGRIAHRLQRLDAISELSASDRQRLSHFSALLDDLRRRAADRSVAELLDDAIRATDYDLKVLCQRNGRRRYANVEKLRETALAFEAESRWGLREFLDYLASLQTLAERETEGPTETEEADVVRLMTVHAAKGLEAPIVIVADLMRGLRSDSSAAVISADGALAVRVKNPLTDSFVDSRDFERLDESLTAADFAEAKRLFYVACTRAQEHLVLSGCAASDKTAKPYGALSRWGEWVAKFLQLEDEASPEPQLVERDGFSIAVKTAIAERPAPATRARPLLARFRDDIEARRPLDLSLIAPSCDDAALRADARSVAERIDRCASVRSAGPVVTVTGAAIYTHCPRRYWLAAIERLPEERQPDDAAHHPRLDREDDLDPRDRGTRLHDLLARIDFGRDPDPELERLAGGWPQGDRDDASVVLRRFWPSDLRKQLAAADARRKLQRETPFVIKAGAGGILRGQIDALMRQGDEWTLVDYKSGQHRDGEYEQQLILYALACRELLGAAPTVGVIYYLDLGETQQVPIDKAALDAAAAALSDVIQGIAAGDFPRRETHACLTCAFAAVCQT